MNDMGVFKWLRRERVTVTSRQSVSPAAPTPEEAQTFAAAGTIRTEEYKRDLAEFQARRSSLNKDITPLKKKCGRHSLPISCTDCAVSPDKTFNYEKKSATKYKKRTRKRAKSATVDDKAYDDVPNVQFLFQNQVFMPGNMFAHAVYSEPMNKKRLKPQRIRKSPDMDVIKHIDFSTDDHPDSPIFYKNNSLPFDVKSFLEGSKCGQEEVDGASGDLKVSSHSSFNKSEEEKLVEVLSELKNFDQWADEQLKSHSLKSNKSADDVKSETSTYGLPVVTLSDLDVSVDSNRTWSQGQWGLIPIQIKKVDVKMRFGKKINNMEIDILRKCRHPNIILLMGLCTNVFNDVHLICERSVDTLYNILHVQGRITSVQTAVSYTNDIANALVFLKMRGFLHTELTSHSIMVTNRDAAKLADFRMAGRLHGVRVEEKVFEITGPQYTNINETRQTSSIEFTPLLSTNTSEVYLNENSCSKHYTQYRSSQYYRWHAPEMFTPDEVGDVAPCSKSDVYSLMLILWETCNAAIPWKSLTYDKLKELYTLWNTGIRLPSDGTYPGAMLQMMKNGLNLDRSLRPDIIAMAETLRVTKAKLDDMEYIVIPTKLKKKISGFSSEAWGTYSPDSEALSPVNVQHEALIHKNNSASESEKEHIYETIRKETKIFPEKHYIDETDDISKLKSQEHFSSACSTPVSKLKAKIKDIGTPGLHRSDSTEYCSILSPDNRHFTINNKDDSEEKPSAKLSRSFTPKSYKSLHIKVPEFDIESVKCIPKVQSSEKASYNFDIKNYSLPSTPIARNNKLRKNAWLSGELNEKKNQSHDDSRHDASEKLVLTPETPAVSANSSVDKDDRQNVFSKYTNTEQSPESTNTAPDSSSVKRSETQSFPDSDYRDSTQSWSWKSSMDKGRMDEEILSGVNVKPLVAIHERWIYEANKKTGRSMSLPEENRIQTASVKPASHSVDALPKSFLQLNVKKTPIKYLRLNSVSPTTGLKSDGLSEQYCQARDNIAKNMNFGKDPDCFNDNTWIKSKSNEFCDTTLQNNQENLQSNVTTNQTDTKNIEEFVKDLIRKEFQSILHEFGENSPEQNKNEELLNRGVSSVIDALKNDDDKNVKTFSRVKISGNNKPLLQITFSRNGENSLQVLDNCVNVTIADNKDKLNMSIDETLADDGHTHSLKRCQAFNALQEARSTEDLYIDDELSTHLHDNFGRIKLIPLHGSLHEILCERQDDCCLVKVKQENGCDTIYFRCDNSDTESRDAVDGQDTVLYKRRISLVEERIQRVIPKEKARPKSEVINPNISNKTKNLSNSTPSLPTKEVEVNLDSVLCYQDSSSEECIKCQMDDDFELLEKEIEDDVNNSVMCSCLGKISEENLSIINEESSGHNSSFNSDNVTIKG